MARKPEGGNPRRPKREPAPLKKRSRYLDGITTIDIKDHEFLRKFVTEYGKIIPARLTGANAKQQRQIKQGVRRARNVGLIP